MERGHLSVIRTGSDGQPYFNLQHRKEGKNVTEYIPRDQVPVAQEHLITISLGSCNEKKIR